MSVALLNQLCFGACSKELQSYLEATSETAWQLVNWLTHARDANGEAISVATEAADTVTRQFLNIISRSSQTAKPTCPVCASKNVRGHCDITIPPDGDYCSTYGDCDWSAHPVIEEAAS